jgi:hypothetical protein
LEINGQVSFIKKNGKKDWYWYWLLNFFKLLTGQIIDIQNKYKDQEIDLWNNCH